MFFYNIHHVAHYFSIYDKIALVMRAGSVEGPRYPFLLAIIWLIKRIEQLGTSSIHYYLYMPTHLSKFYHCHYLIPLSWIIGELLHIFCLPPSGINFILSFSFFVKIWIRLNTNTCTWLPRTMPSNFHSI